MGWLTFVFQICLVFFIGGLTGKRFVTHIFSVAIFLLIIISFELGLFEQVRYAFPNTIAISEKEGWVADTTGLNEKAYLYLTVGGELMEQQLNTQVHMANLQGADMLKEALPEALALQFVKETLGDEAVWLLIDKKMEIYGKEHNNEPNKEPALLFADGTDYLEINKGAMALYKLGETIGFNAFNNTVSQWIGENEGKPARFIDLYETFLDKVSTGKREEIKTLFETVPKN